MKVILIASILPSSRTWNSVIHEVIISLIPPWPSCRRQPGILETSPHVPRTDIPCTHILHGPRMTRLPARNYERAWKNSIPAVNVHASNVASTACKSLSRLTCFNSDKKGHYVIPSQGRTEATLERVPRPSSVHPVPYHLSRRICVGST